jgi:hypothetical protein
MSDGFRAGQLIEDYCRACKTDREHRVIAVDGGSVRVICGYCQSQHNYRGGPRIEQSAPAVHSRPMGRSMPDPAARPRGGDTVGGSRAFGDASRGSAEDELARRTRTLANFPLVSERERRSPPIMVAGDNDLELILRRIIREEAGLTAVAPAEKWRGGDLVLRPGRPGVQEKSWPIETFFHKIVMLRNRLRTLEQQVNASDLPEDQKVRLQSYISGCYGSLTSFNVLFADEADQFKGSGGDS